MPLAYGGATGCQGKEVMAMFYRCDRCGQEKSDDLRVDRTLRIGMFLDDRAFKKELCDSCIKELKKWLGDAPKH